MTQEKTTPFLISAAVSKLVASFISVKKINIGGCNLALRD